MKTMAITVSKKLLYKFLTKKVSHLLWKYLMSTDNLKARVINSKETQ